jgi:hypothetical protein
LWLLYLHTRYLKSFLEPGLVGIEITQRRSTCLQVLGAALGVVAAGFAAGGLWRSMYVLLIC